jgi:hypothetical protein
VQVLEDVGRSRCLLEQHPVQPLVLAVEPGQGAHGRAQQVLERPVDRELGQHVGPGLDVPPHQLGEHGVLVREVLVERAHGQPGRLGDPVGGAARVAVLGQNASSRVQHAVAGGP